MRQAGVCVFSVAPPSDPLSLWERVGVRGLRCKQAVVATGRDGVAGLLGSLTRPSATLSQRERGWIWGGSSRPSATLSQRERGWFWGAPVEPAFGHPLPEGEGLSLGRVEPAFGHPLPEGEGLSLGRVEPAFGHPLPEGEGLSLGHPLPEGEGLSLGESSRPLATLSQREGGQDWCANERPGSPGRTSGRTAAPVSYRGPCPGPSRGCGCKRCKARPGSGRRLPCSPG